MASQIHIHELPNGLDVIETARRFSAVEFLTIFDSAAPGSRNAGRYTFLTAAPRAVCRISECDYGDDPFTTVREWSHQIARPDVVGVPPFCGGIAGFMSYELGHAFERLPYAENTPFRTPALMAGLFDWSIVWDHANRTVRLYVINLNASRSKSTDATSRLNQILAVLNSPTAPGRAVEILQTDADTQHESPSARARIPAAAVPPPRPVAPDGVTTRAGHPLPEHAGVFSNFREADYLGAVDRAIEYIRAGDIFQANLSQQLTAAWKGSAFELYERVRRQNPAPFCGLVQSDDFSVISASPERFIRVSNYDVVETRPIKGTRRRHRSPIADLFTSSELYASEKDRAENVMIVDLLRNDLSRVCRSGSVKVTGLCEIEIFETVQHLVSTVVGRLSPGHDVWDLCRSTIPGGSITGAPKIRAMEIITELEQTTRGAYCGNMFYYGPHGDFDSNILIRTFTLQDGMVQFPVGGGIVADSQPDEEYAETLHKASGMLACLQNR